MSRGSFLIMTVLVLALVGMFVWTLTLHGEVQDLRVSAGVIEPERSGDRGQERRLSALESKYEELDQLMGSTRVDVSSLESSIDRLRGAGSDRDLKLAALAEGRPLPTASLGDAPGSALKAQIEEVLTERQEAERRSQQERRIQGMSRFLLANVEATDQQKSEFSSILMTYYDERTRISREYTGDNVDTASRDNALKVAEEVRNEKLLQVFGATEYGKIEERLNRGRRMMEGRGGGGRRSPRGGGR